MDSQKPYVNHSVLLFVSVLISSLLLSCSGPQATPETTKPTISLSNLRDNGVVHTGFIIGMAGDNVAVEQVEVALDSGNYETATISSTLAVSVSWSYQLPTGSNTWKDGSQHTLSVRSKDSSGNYSTVTDLTVHKGKNQDVNGDGYSDLAIWAQGFSSNTGRVYVYHGGSSGIGSTPSITLTGEATSNFFGDALAIGDVNNDGFADLAVGAFNYNTRVGRVYVYHGGSTGIPNTASQTLTGTADSNFGISVALGDANGDGYEDLAVGANGYDTVVGQTHIYHGGSTGISDTSSQTLTGELAGDTFGSRLAMGDANGDGYADLVVGASYHDSATGRAYVYHGGSTGISATLSQTLTGEGAGYQFGSALAMGDANGDGYAELAVGAYIYNGHWGRAYIYHGGSSGISDTASRILTGASHALGVSHFGFSLAMGDANGDGYADLAVGAKGYVSASLEGWAYVYHGGSSGIEASASQTLEDENDEDYFGYSVALRDLNSDGYADLAVGAYGPNSNTGRVYVYHGDNSGTSATSSRVLDGENAGDLFGRVIEF